MNKVKTAKTAASKPKAEPKPKKEKHTSLDTQKSRMGWLFVSPFLVGFVLLYLPMIVDSIGYSFSELNSVVGGGFERVFVGFENYSYALFKDPQYLSLLGQSVGSLLFNVPAIVIFSLFMAILLNQKMRGRAVFRAIFFIPVIVSTGIIEYIDTGNKAYLDNLEQMSGGDTASVSSSGSSSTASNTGDQIISMVDVRILFGGMAIGGSLVGRVLALVNNVYQIINKSGVQMLIFLSGLQSISPAIYESCYIDGASSWETFWKITFPMISPMILVNAVYTVIDSFTSQSNSLMRYISNIYSQSGGRVRATAMSWMYFLVVIIVLVIVAAIIRAYVFYQRRDT
ncbi:MAG: sugar ABC transporter permease [Clostridia bacterium]|nr:sugar ABC transporter permease [Clostridia bacterium]